jgi:hypothetical protein
VLCQYLVAGEFESRICRILEEKAKTFGETLGAEKNEDDTWFFRDSQEWRHALWHIGYSALSKIGEQAGADEIAEARECFVRSCETLTNPIDRALADELRKIARWQSNQIGAAILLRKRVQ